MSGFLFSVYLQFSNSSGYIQAVCHLISSCQLAAHWLYFYQQHGKLIKGNYH